MKHGTILSILAIVSMFMMFPVGPAEGTDEDASSFDRSLPPSRFNWRAEIGGAIELMETGPDGNIYVASSDGFLHCVTPDGRDLWSTMVQTQDYDDIFFLPGGDILVHAWNDIYRVDDGGKVIEELDLDLRWVDHTMHALGDDVLIRQNEGDLLCFDPETGEEVWSWRSHRGTYTQNLSSGGEHRQYAPTYDIRDLMVIPERDRVLFLTESYGPNWTEQYNITCLNGKGRHIWNRTVPGAVHGIEEIGMGIFVRSVDRSTGQSHFIFYDLDGNTVWSVDGDTNTYHINDGTVRDKVFISRYRETEGWLEFDGTVAIGMDGRVMDPVFLPDDPSSISGFPDGSYLVTNWNQDGTRNLSRFSSDLEPLWKLNLTLGIAGPVRIGPEGTVYLVLSNGAFSAIDMDGRYLFNSSFAYGGRGIGRYYDPDDVSSVSYHLAYGPNGTLYLGGIDLVCMDRSGNIVWEVVMGGESMTSPVLSPSGTVYMGSLNRDLYAIGKDGSVLWRYDCGGPLTLDPVLTSDQESVVQATTWGEVLCVDPSGRLLWNITLNSSIMSEPALLPDGSFVVLSLNRWLYRFDAEGGLIWERYLNRTSNVPMSVGPDGRIYLTVFDGLVCLSDSGGIIWYHGTERWHLSTSAVISDEGRIYVAGDNVTCLNADGEPIWESERISDPTSIAVRSDGSVVVDTYHSGIRCFSRYGEELWSTFIQSMPRILVVDDEDRTYLVNNGLFCLGRDGGILWAYNNGDWHNVGNEFVTRPVITDDGRAYYYNRALYCIEWDDEPRFPLTPSGFYVSPYMHQISIRQNVSEVGYPVMGYNLYRGETPDHMDLYKVFPLNEYGWTEEDFELGEVTYYYVSAYNQFGESPPSRTVWTDHIERPARPTPPRNLSGLRWMDRIEIEWDPPVSDGDHPLIGYMVFRSEDGGDHELIARVGPWNLSYVDLDVDPTTRYGYYVASENERGWTNSNKIAFKGFDDEQELEVDIIIIAAVIVIAIVGSIMMIRMVQRSKERSSPSTSNDGKGYVQDGKR